MNLFKAANRLSYLSYLIARERVDPFVGGKIFVVVFLTVLLYRLVSWVQTSSILNTIQGFHHCANLLLANKKPRRMQNSPFGFYSADEAMRICKLRYS